VGPTAVLDVLENRTFLVLAGIRTPDRPAPTLVYTGYILYQLHIGRFVPRVLSNVNQRVLCKSCKKDW